MAVSINRLLNKKSWTGVEVGKALIASYAHDVRNSGNPNRKPLLSQADFNRMTDSLQTEQQICSYLVYEQIYSSCIEGFNKAQSLAQQFLHGYYRLFMQLEEIRQADNAKKATDDYPLILSRQQYERILEAEKADKRATETNFNYIMFDYLEYCIANEDKAPAAIKTAIEACKKEAAANSRILATYNEDMGEGYYRLPDGTESRSCNSEEWQQALKRNYIKAHNLPADIGEQELKEYVFGYNATRHLEVMELLFKGKEAIVAWARDNGYTEQEIAEITEEQDIEDLIADILKNEGKHQSKAIADTLSSRSLERESYCKWITPTEAPEGLTKYDIIAEPDLLLRYSGGYDDDITEEQQLEEFKADYPKLYKALQAELKKLLKLKKAPAADKVYTWGELADMQLGFYPAYTEVTAQDIIDYYCKEDTEENHSKRMRAVFKGIAIIEQESYSGSSIDAETGNYIEPVNPYSEMFSLDSITTEEAIQIEEYITGLIEPAAKYLQAYNVLIEILAKSYDVADLTAGRVDLDGLEEKCRAFNGMLYLTFEGLTGSPEEKKRKRKLLQDYFRPLEWESWQPTAEAQHRVEDIIGSLGYSRDASKNLKSFNKYIDILMGEGAANE